MKKFVIGEGGAGEFAHWLVALADGRLGMGAESDLLQITFSRGVRRVGKFRPTAFGRTKIMPCDLGHCSLYVDGRTVVRLRD